jgi:hypothetical protein
LVPVERRIIARPRRALLSLAFRPQSIEAARLKLADTILRVANGGTIDPEKLREEALESMFADPLKLKR